MWCYPNLLDLDFFFLISIINIRFIEKWIIVIFYLFFMNLHWSHELNCEFNRSPHVVLDFFSLIFLFYFQSNSAIFLFAFYEFILIL
jgi:hypothetical protein